METVGAVGTVGQPSKAVLRRWRRQIRDAYADQAIPLPEDAPMEVDPAPRQPGPENHLLFLPEMQAASTDASASGVRLSGKLNTERLQAFDPVRLVLALGVTRHLRMPGLFEEVLETSQDYLALDAGERVEHDYTTDPRESTLRDSQARADIVALCLDRRRFRQWRHDGAVRSIHIYSDASPVVGSELQGMILDVMLTDGSLERLVLPGSTLAYGHTDSVSKGVALVWALWLIAGPTTDDLAWVCSKIRSLTTDFGVEMHLLELPDIVQAFVAWVGGISLANVQHLIVHNKRLFGKALRIAGFSHTLGGIMKVLAERSPDWPKDLGHMRSLCRFWKIGSYRTHIARRMPHIENISMLTRSFTAGFAKWRYETVVSVLKQLNRRRVVCEEHLSPALFAHAEDQEMIASVFRACRDKPFWRWAAAALEKVFQDLEWLRQWAMVCDHAECFEIRRKSNFKKRVDCPRSQLHYLHH